jgi:Domain of unknown function DUF11
VISAKRVLLTLALLALSAATAPAMAGAASSAPFWDLAVHSSPTNFDPANNDKRTNFYVITLTNAGSEDNDGSPVTVTEDLPAGLALDTSAPLPLRADNFNGGFCEEGPPIVCTGSGIPVGQTAQIFIAVKVLPGAPASVTNRVTVSGGGAAAVSFSLPTKIGSDPAPFALNTFEGALLDASGAAEARAGSHPYELRIGALFNTILTPGPTDPPTENPKNINVDLPAGLTLNPQATPVLCTETQLETGANFVDNFCPKASQVGLVRTTISLGEATSAVQDPVYNMVSPPGSPATLAFNAADVGVFIHLQGRVRSDGDYGLSSVTEDIPQFANMSGVTVELWGDPSDPSHHGGCPPEGAGAFCRLSGGGIPLLTMPTACSGPLDFGIKFNSWQNPASFLSADAQTKDAAGNPVGVTGCDKLSYNPAAETTLSTNQDETGTGMDVNVDFPNNGLLDKAALAESMTQKAVVTLPEGVTINPSVGEGLGFCTPAQYGKEGTFTSEGEGCPDDSKIGTLHLTTPLLDEALDGSVYLAQQDNPTTTTPGAENPFDTDVALYLVLRNTQVGVLVKQALKVIPDPKTGQLVATLDNIPQLPFNHFNFHFKEGARAALISPAACGRYTTVAKFYPSSDPSNPKVIKSDFEITKGVSGGACPPGGTPSFHPRFEAGSVNNNAKSYSPFNMRLTRADGEQDMTRFGAILPPGVLGKLAGVSKCSDAAIAQAKTKTGRQEKASPSCPASSLIGHTIAGAGVGDSLTYVPGQLYLGGPYNGDPLSVVSITPALAGPFDAGTVVVREALTLNPETAEVQVDGKSSDPIPHILKGIVLKVRDLRVYVDKPEFILNPTSCDPSSAKATLFGANLNVFDSSDDVPVDLATRYQAANCANLGFKPKLSIKLNGGSKRGDHPALKAVVTARNADANIGKAVVTLPQSAFLDQAHIRTICTRVQYAANGGAGGGCPKAAQYGYARAFTPLLDEPVEGPVYLRSSNHKLPDLVAALHGIVDVDIVGRIDSFKGGIRSSFETVPDAPVAKFILNMQGGKKGLVVNSRNLCAGTNKADAALTGQNGVAYDFKPVVKPSCGKARKGKAKGNRRGRGR